MYYNRNIIKVIITINYFDDFSLWYENLDKKQLYDDWQAAKKKVYQEQLVNKQLQYFDQPISRELKTTREWNLVS